MDETLPLRQMMALDNSYWGYYVDRVEVRVRSTGRYADLRLLINGWPEDQTPIVGYLNTLSVRGYKAIGRDIERLQLEVRGAQFIESITVYLSR